MKNSLEKAHMTAVVYPQTAAASVANAPLSQPLSSISDKDRLFARELASQLARRPEVRGDRVAAVSQQIESGAYHPSSHLVAVAILHHLIGD